MGEPAVLPPASCPRPVEPGARTLLAHRGASALAPENTLAAFRLTGEVGARWVELDVDVIGDGTPIVIHDSTLDRTTNRSGSYYDLTVDDLAGIDAGSWFEVDGRRPFAGERLPTLAAALEVVARTGLGVNVEMKSCRAGAVARARLVDGVAELLDEHARRWAGRAPAAGGAPVLVSSFDLGLLERVARRRPGTDLAVLTHALDGRWRSRAQRVGAVAVNPGAQGLERRQVEEVRALGYGVNVWTVNSPSRAAELFSWGVTGVFTDRVHALAPLVA